MPPNLLFIMADQYRHDYLGCAGADWVHTPNLDALAARGVRVTGCCTNAPIDRELVSGRPPGAVCRDR